MAKAAAAHDFFTGGLQPFGGERLHRLLQPAEYRPCGCGGDLLGNDGAHQGREPRRPDFKRWRPCLRNRGGYGVIAVCKGLEPCHQRINAGVGKRLV